MAGICISQYGCGSYSILFSRFFHSIFCCFPRLLEHFDIHCCPRYFTCFRITHKTTQYVFRFQSFGGSLSFNGIVLPFAQSAPFRLSFFFTSCLDTSSPPTLQNGVRSLSRFFRTYLFPLNRRSFPYLRTFFFHSDGSRRPPNSYLAVPLSCRHRPDSLTPSLEGWLSIFASPPD